jgi:hypothetical protein
MKEWEIETSDPGNESGRKEPCSWIVEGNERAVTLEKESGGKISDPPDRSERKKVGAVTQKGEE